MDRMGLVGATGAIGKSIARVLDTQQIPYRVIARDEVQLRTAFPARQVDLKTWNPADPASVRSAFRGMETLFYLVGVPYNHFELHPTLMRTAVEAAVAEGVRRMVLIGTVYPYGTPRTTPVTEEHPREPHTFKGRMRKEQEDILLAADAAGHLQGTILRVPDFYGPEVGDKSLVGSLFKAAVKGGTADLIGPINTPHQYAFVADVGPIALALAQHPGAYGKSWSFAGSGTTTQAELIALASSYIGHRIKYRVIGKTALRLVGIFNPIVRELVEMHYLQTSPVLMDDAGLRGLLEQLPRTSYAEGVRMTIEALRAQV